jgi:uncharacterized protein (UPF0332 family)
LEWSTYLDLARELAEQESDAKKRSAVSRAYYAMYCTARDKLQGIGDFEPPSCGSDHFYLWNRLAKEPYYSTSVRDLGMRLRDARVEADYENYIHNLPHFAESAILDAEELEQALEALFLL